MVNIVASYRTKHGVEWQGSGFARIITTNRLINKTTIRYFYEVKEMKEMEEMTRPMPTILPLSAPTHTPHNPIASSPHLLFGLFGLLGLLKVLRL